MDKSNDSQISLTRRKGKGAFLCRTYATSFLNFSAPGHTTSPCINCDRDLVFYSITFMFKRSGEIILKIWCKNFKYK